MSIKTNNRILPFPQQTVEAISRIIGDTGDGLTGSNIEHALVSCKIPDVDPTNTKWKRLYNALAEFGNKHQMGNHIVKFINHVMNPASHTEDPEKFYRWRNTLNRVLSLNGMEVSDNGKVVKVKKAKTLDEAVARANHLKDILKNRETHTIIITHCLEEIKTENYFHAVLEAIKSITVRIRHLSNLDGDGAQLIQKAFAGDNPLLKINDYNTKSQIGEQRGFVSLVSGLYGMIRNPLAHEAKIEWDMNEQDALEVISTISFIHRRLDSVVGIKGM